MVEFIGKFKYDEKNMYIFKKEGKIYFAVERNKKISLKLNKEEQDVFIEIYSQIAPRKEKTKYMATIQIKNKKFCVYYDEFTNLYYFMELCGDKKITPKVEDLIMLNTIYNNQSEYLYALRKDKSTLNDRKINLIQRFCNLSKKRKIALLLSAGLAFNQIMPLETVANYEKTFMSGPVSELNDLDLKINGLGNVSDEELHKRLEEAVNSNNNISDKDKEIIMDIYPEIVENKEYLKRDIFDKIETLEIEHSDEIAVILYKTSGTDKTEPPLEIPKDRQGKSNQNEIPKSMRTSTMARYNPIKNKINARMYEIKESEEYSDTEKHNLYHELNHLLSSQEGLLSADIELMEMFNEMFTRDYHYESFCRNDTPGYVNTVGFAYVLNELLPEDVVRKYKYNPNTKYIRDALYQIDDTKEGKENVNEFLVKLQLLHGGHFETIKEIEQLFKDLYKSLDKMYEKKYNKSIEENEGLYMQFIDKNYYGLNYEPMIKFCVDCYLYGIEGINTDADFDVKVKTNLCEESDYAQRTTIIGKNAEENKSISLQYALIDSKKEFQQNQEMNNDYTFVANNDKDQKYEAESER